VSASSTEPADVPVETDAGVMPAHRWVPESGAGPGILLLHEIFGVSAYVRDRAADLAAAGYVVLAPEIFWRLGISSIEDSTADALQEGVAARQRVDWDASVGDVRAALQVLRRDEHIRGGVGVLGFCFGGGLAFNLAAVDPPDILVSYYGSDIPRLLDLAPQVTAPSLHHFGLDDAYLAPDVVERVRVTLSRSGVEVRTYAGAGHAFDNPMPMFHHPEASAAAWTTTLDFLHRELPVQAPVQS
jgi:carboxymethylenebutenolidase